MGVVMFVLALAILGLSLFSLSSYEAGFFQASLDQERATQRAAGGIELVKRLVTMNPDDLGRAKLAQGRLGIVYANAWQVVGATLDSTGGVDWSRRVFIRVKTQTGSRTRMVEGEFIPVEEASPYKRLITSNLLISHPLTGGSTPTSRLNTTTLIGNVWQSVRASSDTAWTGRVVWSSGRPMRTVIAPVPDVTGFLSANLSGATPQVAWQDSTLSTHEMKLDAGSGAGANRFFRSPVKTSGATTYSSGILGASFDFFDDRPTSLHVRGTCIWMVPAGIRFESMVTVDNKTFGGGGAGPHTLIIAAGPNGRLTTPQDYRDIGIWFFGGLEIEDGVRVFLVTDGELRLEDFSGGNASDVDGINLFSDGLFLMGPTAPSTGSRFMRLRYRSDMDALVDDLVAAGRLPAGGTATATSFTLVPGSWREE